MTSNWRVQHYELILNMQILVKGVCPGCVFESPEEEWQWLTEEQRARREAPRNTSYRGQAGQEIPTNKPQSGEGREKTRQQEVLQEDLRGKGPPVVYLGGGVQIVEKRKGEQEKGKGTGGGKKNLAGVAR